MIYNCFAAASADAVCFNRFDDERYDPFEPVGNVGFYQHGDQPLFWSTALDQFIVSVTHVPQGRTDGAIFASLSAEGDVTFHANAGPVVEEIPGAGVIRGTTSGRGRLTALRWVGTTCFACGAHGQIYRRSNLGGWSLLGADWLSDPSVMRDFLVQSPAISEFNGAGALAGWVAEHPLPVQIDINDVNGPDGDNLYIVGEDGFLGFWNGRGLVASRREDRRALTGIFVESPGTIWICGRDGAIYKGNRNDGFRPVANGGRQLLLSMASWRGDIYVVSHANPSGLFTVDRTREALRPVAGVPAIPGMHTISVVEDIIWLAGINDILRFDGRVWDYVNAPGMRDMP